MAATFTWTLQGATADTTIGATDKVQFAGSGGFDTAVTVGTYQRTTHVKSSGGSNLSSGNNPRNNEFGTSNTKILIDGAAEQTISATVPTQAQSTLKITFTDGAVGSTTTSAVTFFAYNISSDTTDPTDVTVEAFESTDGQEDSQWTRVSDGTGANNPLTLVGQGPTTTHTWYVPVSASPNTPGLKGSGGFGLKIALTYQ